MMSETKNNERKTWDGIRELPKILKRYENSDFLTQQKVRFVYHLCISIIGGLILIILSSSYIQINDSNYNGIYLPVLIPEIIVLIIFFLCLFFLIKGHYVFSANLILISSIVCIWFVMWTDKTEAISRLDSIAFVFAILSTTPLFISKNKYYILFYSALNVLILFFFVLHVKVQLNITSLSALDYFIDSTIAIVFLGVVGYNIFNINKSALKRAETDIKERKEAENALAISEKKYREMTDLLPQTVFESDINGQVTYINKNGIELFGYTSDDIIKGINVLSYICEKDRKRASENFKITLSGKPVSGNQYMALRKDGTSFPMQIFSNPIVENKTTIGLRGIVINISDRIKSEEEIKRSRDQYQSLVANIPGITYRCLNDKDWTMLFISSEIEKFCGYPSEEFINNHIRTFASIVHPDDNPPTTKAIEEAIKLSKPWEIEYRVLHRDGGYRWVYEKGRAIPDSEGKVIFLDGFILDITERKRLDELLQESELRYKTLIETSQDGISLMDLNGTMHFVNKRKVEMVRASSDLELIGKSAFSLLTEKSQTAVRNIMPKVIQQGYMDSLEANVLRMDGTIIDAEFNLTVLKDSNGVPLYLMDTMRDITDRKQADEALRESELRYRRLFENAQIGIYQTTPDGKIIRANPSLIEMLGFDSFEDLEKRDLEAENVYIDTTRDSFKEQIEKQGVVVGFESKWKKKNGEAIIIVENARAVRDSEGKTIYYDGFIENITERKKTETELFESQQLFQALSQMSPVGIFRTRTDGFFTYVNPKWTELTGLNLESAFGNGWLNAIHPEDRESVQKEWEFHIKEGSKFIREYRYLKPDGDVTWVIGVAVPEIVNNEITGFVGTNTNITKRTKAEKALKESEEKYRTLMESMNEVVMMVDNDDRVQFVNKKFTEILGYTSDEIIGFIGYEKLLEPIDHERLINENQKRTKKITSQYELTFIAKDGRKINFLVSGAPITDIDGKTLGSIGAMIDITERKKTEEAISRARSQLQGVLDAATEISIIAAEPSGNIVVFNKGAEKMLGYLEEEVIGKKTPEFLHLKSEIIARGKELSQEFNRKIEGFEVFIAYARNFKSDRREWTYVCKDGSHITVNLGITAVTNEKNEIIGYLGIAIDVTEQKKADKALKESQRLFQTLAQMSPVGIFRTRADGFTTYVNPKWSELSGLSFDEALGDGWLKAVHPEDRETLNANWESNAQQGQESVAEYRFLKPDGSVVWVLGDASPEIVDNKIKGYIGTLTDITQRKEAEKALQESEERYRTIIEAFPDIIMISDLNGNIIFGNEPFEKITGITPSDYSNPKRTARIHPDDLQSVSDAFDELLTYNKTHTGIIENRYIDSWGKMHWFSGIISKIVLNGQIMRQFITRDVTEKKAIEKELENYRNNLEHLVNERTEELAAANEELTSTNEELYYQRKELEVALENLQNAQKQLLQAEKMASLGVLAAGVAHEINNPLNFINGGILGIENYFRENLSNHVENVLPLIEAINTGIFRAADIVKSLNRFSRQTDSINEKCDLHSIINSCLVILKNETKNRINITNRFTKELFTISGNEGKLHQAVLNVLSNATHAIEKDGTITITTKVKNKMVILTISDTGHGIKQEDLNKIFDPFFTTKEPGKGTGLGLAITYQIIKDFDGTIEYQSEKGFGTTVIISFPIDKN